MAKKKNRYEGMSKQDIDVLKQEKRFTMIAALFFIMMIAAGLLLSTTNLCGWYSEDELNPSATDAAVVEYVPYYFS